MRRGPEHRREVTELLGQCADIGVEASVTGPLPDVSERSTIELIEELRACWAAERLYRAKLADGSAGDERRDNASMAVAVRDELIRRRAESDRRRGPAGPSL